MRQVLAIATLTIAITGVAPGNAASPSGTALQLSNVMQISDILGAFKSAINGKKRRRSRGSNRPILDKPPVLPDRNPLDRAQARSETVLPQPQIVAETRKRKERTPASKPALRPTIVATVTVAPTTMVIPTRRPSKAPRKRAVTAADNQSLATEAPPLPDIWQPHEISAAYDTCEALLARKSVEFEPVDPIRKGLCGMPGPVKLSALGEHLSVSVKPSATLNCRTVARIHDWMESKVQPAAMKYLNSPVVRIRNVSSYSCRRRNNAATGKMSEHSLGNALDIAGFVLADGRTVSVLSDWGPVQRDIAAQQANKSATLDREPTRIATTAQAPDLTQTVYDNTVPIPIFRGPVRRGVRLNRIPDPGDPIDHTARASGTQADAEIRPTAPPAKSLFLKHIHADACGIFGTVLGPEANDAHRDHFHIDTAKRRYKAYCR